MELRAAYPAQLPGILGVSRTYATSDQSQTPHQWYLEPAVLSAPQTDLGPDALLCVLSHVATPNFLSNDERIVSFQPLYPQPDSLSIFLYWYLPPWSVCCSTTDLSNLPHHLPFTTWPISPYKISLFNTEVSQVKQATPHLLSFNAYLLGTLLCAITNLHFATRNGRDFRLGDHWQFSFIK